MSNFSSSLIFRHLQPGNNVIPRLPGKFEPLDNSANDNLSGFSTVQANLPEQPAVKIPKSQQVSPELLKRNEERISEIVNPVSSVQTSSLKNEYGIEERNPENPVNTRKLTTPIQNLPFDDFDQTTPPIDTTQNLGSDSRIVTEIVNQKENHFVVTNNSKIIHEEQIINRLNEKPSALSDTVLSPESNEIKPFPENTKVILPAEKSSGVFGEPPGAIAFNNTNENRSLSYFPPETEVHPVIKVSIGQINVRAVTPSPSFTIQKPRVAPKPALSLEDYLKQRSKE
jgi:hypothetical protein